MSANIQGEGGEPCPTCHELFNLLMDWQVAQCIYEEATKSHELYGVACGVLLTDPACLPDDASRAVAKVDAARCFGYYLDARPIDELKKIAQTSQAHRESVAALRQFDSLLERDEVPMLAIWKGCVAYFIVNSDPHISRQVFAKKERNPFDCEHMRIQLLSSKANTVGRADQNTRVMAATAPSRAAESADTPLTENCRPSSRETHVDPRLVRMVLRVAPELQEALITLSERLFDETGLEYSYAAIVRGLIALGLSSIAGKGSLAVEFAGARVARGKRRSARWKPSGGLDE